MKPAIALALCVLFISGPAQARMSKSQSDYCDAMTAYILNHIPSEIAKKNEGVVVFKMNMNGYSLTLMCGDRPSILISSNETKTPPQIFLHFVAEAGQAIVTSDYSGIHEAAESCEIHALKQQGEIANSKLDGGSMHCVVPGDYLAVTIEAEPKK
jgi:hypothetical protein